MRWEVLDRYKMPGGPEREVTDAYAQAIFAEEAPLHEDERITVYAVPEAIARGPYLILAPGWQPRQTNDKGRVWRELPAGQPAGLEIVDPEGRPLTLAVTATGAGVLRLLDQAGRELASWQFGSDPAAAQVEPATIPSDAPSLPLVLDAPDGAAAVIVQLALHAAP